MSRTRYMALGVREYKQSPITRFINKVTTHEPNITFQKKNRAKENS